MKLTYFFRVFLISFELLILLTSFLIISVIGSQTTPITEGLSLNSEIATYITLLPTSLFLYIISSVQGLIFTDKENIRLLVNWPEYWQLKIHVYVSIIYGLIFLLMSVFAWLSKDWFYNNFTLITFLTSCVGLIWAAGSIYLAKMSVLEIINQ